MTEHTTDKTLEVLRARTFWLVFLVAAIIVVRVMLPFLGSLLAASVVVTLLWPVRQFLMRLIPYPTVARGMTLLAFLLFVFMPITGIVLLFIERIPRLVAKDEIVIWADQAYAMLPDFLRAQINELIGDRAGIGQWASKFGQNLVSWIAEHAGGIAQASTTTALGLVVFVLAVWVFLERGDAMLRTLMHLSPLDDELEQNLFMTFQKYARALILGALVIAGAQSLAAMIVYYFVDVTEVFFLGVLTGLLGFVPVVGSALVWAPLAAIAWAEGAIANAIIIVIFGTVVVSTIDAVLRPLVMRGDERMSTVLILMSIFGGFMWLGFWGLLLGPIAVSFFMSLTAAYDQQILTSVRQQAMEAEASDHHISSEVTAETNQPS